MLPEKFLGCMQKMLGEEYPAFLAEYEKEKRQALRINPLKTGKEEFCRRVPFHLRPVPWSRYGFYYAEEDCPGKHPYHEAGVYYIQEPSAQLVAGLLQVRPGERILDLCAAPGGKSTQLAADMQGEGILVCNEIHPARAKILSENMERLGIANAVVTNESPEKLSGRFGSFFDGILVDAPCSGEGMFRKNEEACSEWSEENVQLCAKRQDEILDKAAVMLRPGGRLVYSTCTFAPEENEGSISRFLKRHQEFTLVEVSKENGLSDGVAAWIREPAEHLERTVRLWPHKLEGEGHFAALLQKAGGVSEEKQVLDGRGRGAAKGPSEAGKEKDSLNAWKMFLQEALCSEAEKRDQREGTGGTRQPFEEMLRANRLVLSGEQLYLVPEGLPSLAKLKVLRPGLHLGTVKKRRFEPAHALALFLQREEVRFTFDLASDGEKVRAYLSGQTFSAEGDKGWYLITVDGYSLGWGKLAGGIMKNHYPKGLRKN